MQLNETEWEHWPISRQLQSPIATPNCGFSLYNSRLEMTGGSDVCGVVVHALWTASLGLEDYIPQ